MFEELLIPVLFIIVLIILCIISNLYSKKERETIKNNDTDWMNIFKKKEKINELNRLLIDELIEDIVLKMLLEKHYLWVEKQIQTVL